MRHKLIWNKPSYEYQEKIIIGSDALRNFINTEMNLEKEDINSIFALKINQKWEESTPFGVGLEVIRLE